MTSSTIPSVLYVPNGNSLSIERALKQAIELLHYTVPVNEEVNDAVNVTIDDLETILRHLDRS